MRVGSKQIKIEDPGEKIFMGFLITSIVAGFLALVIIIVAAVISILGLWMIPIVIGLPFLLAFLYFIGDKLA